jgi:hypothetical protein
MRAHASPPCRCAAASSSAPPSMRPSSPSGAARTAWSGAAQRWRAACAAGAGRRVVPGRPHLRRRRRRSRLARVWRQQPRGARRRWPHPPTPAPPRRARSPRPTPPPQPLASSARNLETNERIAIKKITGVFDNPVDAKRTLRRAARGAGSAVREGRGRGALWGGPALEKRAAALKAPAPKPRRRRPPQGGAAAEPPAARERYHAARRRAAACRRRVLQVRGWGGGQEAAAGAGTRALGLAARGPAVGRPRRRRVLHGRGGWGAPPLRGPGRWRCRAGGARRALAARRARADGRASPAPVSPLPSHPQPHPHPHPPPPLPPTPGTCTLCMI